MPKRDHGVLATSWWGATVPTTGPTGTAATWVGVTCRFGVAGRVAGFRFYVPTGNDGAMRCSLWDFPLTTQHRAAWARERSDTSGPGWQQVWFPKWLRVTLDPFEYRVAVLFPSGGFFRNNTVLGGSVVHNNIRYVASFQSTSLVPELAAISTNTNANAVDVLFYPD